MAYVGFEPDPDFSDEFDFGYGTFIGDDGSRRYGYDPDLARQLPDQRLAANVPQPTPTPPLLDERLGQTDAQRNLARDFTPAPLETSNGRQNQAEAPAQAQGGQGQGQELLKRTDTNTGGGSFDTTLEQRAREAGLDPAAIKQVIMRESGGKPDARNPKSGATGLIQFMPDTAASLGTTTDALAQMSAEEQVPYVVEYFKSRGVTKDTPAHDYYTAVAAPAALGKSDEHVVYRKGSKAYEQNQTWDGNRDGDITTGELREWGGGGAPSPDPASNMSVDDPALANQSVDYRGGDQMSRMASVPGTQPGAAPGAQAPGAAGASPRGPVAPGAMGPYGQPLAGMAPSGAKMQGVPMTGDEMSQREAEINTFYQTQQEKAQRELDNRIKIRNDAGMRVASEAEALRNAGVIREQRNFVIGQQAERRIQEEFEAPTQKVDQRRIFSNMSTGQKIVGFLASILGGIGSALTKGPNYALEMLQHAQDQDIEVQKDEIRRGEASRENRVAHWTRILGDAKQGEIAARAEQQQAMLQYARARDLSIETADVQAAGAAVIQGLEGQRINNIAALKDNERNRLSIEFQPPATALTGALPVGAHDPAVHDPVMQARLVNEFMTLKPNERQQALDKYQASVDTVDGFGRLVDKLAEKYGAEWDPQKPNALAADPQTGETKGSFGSASTGPWWNPFDYDTPLNDAFGVVDQRDRQLKQLWDQVRLQAREGWKTEPNGQVWQQRLSEIQIPQRDADVPAYLEQLKSLSMQMKNDVDSSASPQVRAYRAAQQRTNMQGAYRPVQGRVGAR